MPPSNCGGMYNQVTLNVSGTGGACAAKKSFSQDLSSYVNNQIYDSYSYMPYFQIPVPAASPKGYITGRVTSRNGSQGYWDFGGFDDGYEYPDYGSCLSSAMQRCTMEYEPYMCSAMVTGNSSLPVSGYGSNRCSAMADVKQKLCLNGQSVSDSSIQCYRVWY